MLNAFNIHQFQVKTLLRLNHTRGPLDKQSYETATYL